MWKLVALYLVAIVAANLLVAQFGAGVIIFNAFVFIGLDLTTRDSLHEHWQGRQLWLKMLLLIGAGSLLSAVLNWNAAPIAIASFLAFLGTGIVDTLMYQALGERTRFVKMNGSNLVSAAVDSILFPLFAFGLPLMIPIVLGQFAAKVIGGFVWSFVLTRRKVEAALT